jgi:hypothetical protein
MHGRGATEIAMAISECLRAQVAAADLGAVALRGSALRAEHLRVTDHGLDRRHRGSQDFGNHARIVMAKFRAWNAERLRRQRKSVRSRIIA